MDLKRLPFLPLHFFYFQFSAVQKRMFLILMAVLLVTGVCFTFAYLQPDFWALQINEAPDTSVEEVIVDRVEHNYREFDLPFNAFRQWVTYSAGPLLPAAFPVIVFMLLQIIGWSGIMAATTTIQSKWIYFFYFLFTLFIHFTDVAKLILPDSIWGARILEFGIVITFLGIGHVFQTNILKWNVLWRFSTILTLSLIVFFIPLTQSGWEVWHKMATELFTYLIILSILFFYFIGKEPTNLIIFATNNRPEKAARLDHRIILGFMIVYLVMIFILANEYLNFGLFPKISLGLTPTFLLIISLLFTVFTSQNNFHQVRGIFTSLSAFSFILISWSIIIGGFLFFNYSVGDRIFVFAIERIAIIFFFSIGIIHTIFIWLNHGPLLKQKINLYYLMTQGTRFNMYVVWLVGLVSFLAADGKEGWKSINLLSYSLSNHEGDQAMILGDSNTALEAYKIGVLYSPGNVKANFNLASLYLGNTESFADAAFYYQQATSTRDFAPARLNAANLFYYNNQPFDAKKVLKAGMEKGETDPYVANNLGFLYLQENNPDSAIVTLKKGLLADLDISTIYSNLALLYHDNDRPDQAHEFFKASIETSTPSNSSKINYLFHQLSSNQTKLNGWEIEKDDYFLVYNQMLHQIKSKDQKIDKTVLKSLAQDGQSPDALVLDTYLMFNQDSISHAMSLIDFLVKNYPSHGATASYLLGVKYYQRDVPEMARKLFRQAGEAGKPEGLLYEAKMDIDLGRLDTANAKLSLFRALHEEYWESTSKELAMLLKAYGQDVYAMTEWDLSTLNYNEKVRIGKYADSLNQFVNALEAFRAVQILDTSKITPYIELGKIYNKYNDTLAIENLKYGLQLVDPKNRELKLELSKAYLKAGKIADAQKVRNELSPDDDSLINQEHFALLSLDADIALANLDTNQAIVFLDSVIRLNPMATDETLKLAAIYKAQDNFEAGNILISQALYINQENPDLWLYYAYISRSWNLLEDAGYGALKAIELTDDIEKRRQISAEFLTEIKMSIDESQ